MKKIMFDNRFALTKSVLEGHKTMTRRVIKLEDYDVEYLDTAFDWDLRELVIIDRYAQYKVGEIVAISQSYMEIMAKEYLDKKAEDEICKLVENGHPGCTNKMFVRADLMPHQIRITNIKVERLKNISSEDSLKEGVRGRYIGNHLFYVVDGLEYPFLFPKDAFAALINKVNGKGTWERNPWVFAYSFELVR